MHTRVCLRVTTSEVLEPRNNIIITRISSFSLTTYPAPGTGRTLPHLCTTRTLQGGGALIPREAELIVGRILHAHSIQVASET